MPPSVGAERPAGRDVETVLVLNSAGWRGLLGNIKLSSRHHTLWAHLAKERALPGPRRSVLGSEGPSHCPFRVG